MSLNSNEASTTNTTSTTTTSNTATRSLNIPGTTVFHGTWNGVVFKKERKRGHQVWIDNYRHEITQVTCACCNDWKPYRYLKGHYESQKKKGNGHIGDVKYNMMDIFLTPTESGYLTKQKQKNSVFDEQKKTKKTKKNNKSKKKKKRKKKRKVSE